MMTDGDFKPDPLRQKLVACQVRIKKLRNTLFLAKSRSLQAKVSSDLVEAQAEERDLERRIARLERAGRN